MYIDKEIINRSGCASSPDPLGKGKDLLGCGKCILCKDQFNSSTVFKSSVTNERFVFDGVCDAKACKTRNVVYLITCQLCNIQYVGETTTPLASRFYGHRGAIKRSQINTILYTHFLNAGHTYHHCKVQIIYHYDKKDGDAKKTLLNVEEFYMRKLGTIHPFGLNDKISSMNLCLGNYDFRDFHSLNSPFFSFPSPRRGRSHGHRKTSKPTKEPDVLTTIDNIFDLYHSFRLHDLYVLLRSMSRNLIDDCLQQVDEHTTNYKHKGSSVTLILLAYRSQFIKPPPRSKDSKENLIYFSVPFVHSALETVGVDDILKFRDITAFLPFNTKEIQIRTTYSYGPTVGRKLFNYNKILKNLSKKDLNSLTCDCKDEYSDFVYPPHGHVHTGNLNIIQCVPLREVMSKGAKYRLKPSITKNKIITILEESLLKLKRALARKSKTTVSSLDLWYEALLKKVKIRVHSLTEKQLESNDIFGEETVNSYLEKFLHRFVIVPVDKASNNFAVICKKFYIEVLMKELGITSGKISGNEVYKHIRVTPNKFFRQQEKAIKEFDCCLEEENQHIPLLYWTSKQHKSPYKFRFIAGASHCYNKTVSVEVSLALKCIKSHFKNYCSVIMKNRGLRFFWSIDNSVEFLLKLSGVTRANSIKTYDFSTLYTNLPLDYIYECLEKLIIKMYKNSGAVGLLINADRKKAFWSQGCSYPGYKLYTIDRLLDALKYILYNTYVQFAGNVFKQTQGIPMGGNASPFIADLCLAWAEYCYMMELSKSKDEEDQKLARALSNNSRYIDDISVLNYLGFGGLAKKIYHPSLLLEESTSSYHQDCFLDLNIRVYNQNFVIGIYHKVDDFNFEVINFPFPDSNIHSKVGYNAFYSQLVRFYRLCNNIYDFSTRVKLLFNKLEGRGYSANILKRFFLKFCSRYPCCEKYCMQDGHALWGFVFSHQTSKACSVYDYEAIKKITRPCTVVLKDVNGNETVQPDDCPSTYIQDVTEEPNLDTDTDSSLCSMPQPLLNPRNHCYINSVLQVLHRVLTHYTEGVNINNNTEGCLVQCLIDHVYSNTSCGLEPFKSKLMKYNNFFNGNSQQDAYECFVHLLDILHHGTKEHLVDDPSLMDDEQFVQSLPKRLFSFLTKQTSQCTRCRFISTSFTTDRVHILYPKNNSGFYTLFNNSLQENLIKTCSCCHHTTTHEINMEFEQPPEILTCIISRFDSSNNANKNKSKILLDGELQMSSCRYNLIGSVHHYGESVESGHYISNIFFEEYSFTCNDSQIVPLHHLEPSESAYLVFYARARSFSLDAA